ncbi:Coiled-coil domain-containing protein [Arachis hypogaea]|nr:Coiled-coil domain-containing protein [Arachis hypogaea]
MIIGLVMECFGPRDGFDSSCEVEAEGECDESGVAKVDQRVKMDLIEDLLQIWEILECNECVNSENVYSHSVKSYPSNDVLPLQYYTNENQILGLFGVRNTGVLGYAMSVMMRSDRFKMGQDCKNSTFIKGIFWLKLRELSKNLIQAEKRLLMLLDSNLPALGIDFLEL